MESCGALGNKKKLEERIDMMRTKEFPDVK
jgi:hypothetical protein